MKRTTRLAFTFLTLLPLYAAASPQYGGNLAYVLDSKEPNNLRGYQMALNYDPDRFKWRKFNVYFDVGVSHFSVAETERNSSINIYSIAPVIRYSFKERGPFQPYLEFSIGLSYMNQTRLANRNLGMHFAFQDRMGVGTSYGSSKKLTFGLHAVHYSNAHLAGNNSGITIPLVLNIGYRFD